MGSIDIMRRGWTFTRGLRGLVRHPVTREEAERTVAAEAAGRAGAFLTSLDRLVWPYPDGGVHRLLRAAGVEAGDVRGLVATDGLEGALERLRDAGVYVAYEEYLGRSPARRGSTTLELGPADFFNPVTRADYMATTGGSRSAGTPVELSFAYQRRQGVQRAIQFAMAGVDGAPSATWLPVFPSAAGFGAVMKLTAGGNRPERWFSQVPTDLKGIAAHKQAANRFLPALNALARTGLPSPEHVPTDDPEPVVRWLRDALDRAGRATITGYASSITAAARWATDHGVDLTGAVAYPSSEPVTAGKLAAIRATGMKAFPTYAFVPEGTVALTCQWCADEEYHLWTHELALVTRARERDDGHAVDAFCLTSLSEQAPRVLLNVENDDYGTVEHDAPCDCELGRLGLRTKVSGIRGLSKVVAAGVSLDGEVFDRIVEVALPARTGGGPGDYQFVEEDTPSGTVVSLRVHPRLGSVDEAAAMDAVREVLHATENGVLAARVWTAGGGLRIERSTPAVTRAGKTLSYERLAAGMPAVPELPTT